MGIINMYLTKTMKGKGITNQQFKVKCESHRASMAVYSFSLPTATGSHITLPWTKTVYSEGEISVSKYHTIRKMLSLESTIKQ